VRRPVCRGLALVTAVVLASCEHAQPFGAADLGLNAPFSTILPRQLTFSGIGNLTPAWLPDASGIIYAYQRFDRADHDRCLGILPAEGGHLERSICHAGVAEADSANTLWSPAVGPGGVLAYVRESSVPGTFAPWSRELVVATLDDPDPGRVMKTFPYTAPDGLLHGTAAYLCWADARTLVYLAENLTYTAPPLPVDTLATPVEVVELSLSGDTAIVTVVPGTLGATSVAADSVGGIYYTLPSDSRVYRVDPGGGPATVLYDFGAIGPAADAQVRGGRLVAIAGGGLYGVDLTSGVAVPITLATVLQVRHPALSPTGSRVVAEVYGAGPGADLWLFEVP
jgi:hypothetical protein